MKQFDACMNELDRRIEEAIKLKVANAALVEALDHLLDDVECHCDGDDRSMTLDITAEQARAALKLAKGE